MIGGGLICLLLIMTSAASTRVYIGIGFGASYGCYPHYYGYHHYPYYRWHGYYGGYHYPWYWHSYYPGYYYSPGSSVWISGYYPIVIGQKPAPREPESSNPTEVAGATKRADRQTMAELGRSIGRHKSEQLKVLKIGTKGNRLRAIRELARFPNDPKVREALERVLLSDPDPELRKQVATVFGTTENPKTVAALKTAKAIDPDRDVRQAAYRAIIMIEGY
jgi:hypothetical protein